MLLKRIPSVGLRPMVRSLWAQAAAPSALAARPDAAREHVLPTGDMHLVLRLSGPALRLFRGDADRTGYTVGHAIVGGARSAFYARDVSVATASVGAQLRPGAARALFGLPADELAERRTPLDLLWGAEAATQALERVHAAVGLEARLCAFEEVLLERIDDCALLAPLHPAVAMSLRRLAQGARIGSLVEASGYSHRHFVALFKEAAGLNPKRMERVLRVQRAIATDRSGAMRWVDVALHSGYGDQSHFNRDFLDITGMTPARYRHAQPASPNHVGQFSTRRDRTPSPE